MFYKNNIHVAFIIFFFVMMFAACNSASSTEPALEDSSGSMVNMDEEREAMDHDDEANHKEDEMEDMDHEHEDHAEARVPNPGGATIRILSPTDGDEFVEGDQIIVDVEVENFTLGEDGNHWHVYVDGESFGMVVGGNTDQPLTGVEPGEREISVYLANGDHEEFIEGDRITVIVK